MKSVDIQPFSQKLKALAATRGPFCLGIDPTEELLQSWGLSQNITGLKKMCEIVIEAAGNRLALVKPQAAYFEQYGPEGFAALRDLVQAFHQQETLVLFDGKRGDIGSTSLAYAKAYLGSNSPYQFDAMTVTAYLGFDAIKPILEYATQVGAGVFVVTRSSNVEGQEIQNAMIDKCCLADYIAEKISAFNLEYSQEAIGPVGAVMGATLKNVQETVRKLDNAFLLAPGIGYQGATMNDLIENYQGAMGRIIPSSSRAVLSHGPDIHSLSNEIERSCQESLVLNGT